MSEEINETEQAEPGLEMPEGYDYYMPFKPYAHKEGEVFLVAPVRGYTTDEAREVIKKIGTDENLTKDQKQQLLQELHSILSGIFEGGRYDGVVSDDKPIAQYLQLDGKKVATKFIEEHIKEGTERLKGAAAVRRVSAMLGIGRSVVWAGHHSGLILTIGNFQPGALFAMQTRLLETVATVGMATRGQIFSADDVHIVSKEVDFILDHVFDANLKGWTTAKLRAHLDVRDIQPLLSAALSAIYPKGYPFMRDCAFKTLEADSCQWSTLAAVNGDPKKMTRLDFRQITHVDTSKFTRKQIRHLQGGMQSVTEKDLVEYRDEFDTISLRSDVINDTGNASYRLVIQAPMYDRYRAEGLEWIGDVEFEVTRALEEAPEVGAGAADNRRSQYINSFITRVTAQRHMSWITAILEESPEGDLTYDDRETISALLGEQSKVSSVAENIIGAVEQFKVDHFYTFTAIPNFSCPDCGEPQAPSDTPRPSLIPISVIQYFFDIMASRPGRNT